MFILGFVLPTRPGAFIIHGSLTVQSHSYFLKASYGFVFLSILYFLLAHSTPFHYNIYRR